MQGITIMERVVNKAAHKLGIDQVEIRRLNAPEGKAPWGPGSQRPAHHALDELLPEAGTGSWRGPVRVGGAQGRSGKRIAAEGSRRGRAMSVFFAGSSGYDGLLVVKPDGRLYLQSGIGNHGTESVSDVHRVAAEMLGIPWDKCVVTWGDTSRNLPWTCVSGGSQTTLAMTRAAHAAASDARRKFQEIAATRLGGRPEDYDLANERVIQSERWAWHDAGPGCAGRDRAGRKVRRP